MHKYILETEHPWRSLKATFSHDSDAREWAKALAKSMGSKEASLFRVSVLSPNRLIWKSR